MESEGLPLRVATEAEEYIRLQYEFCPQSVERGTVGRSLSRDPEDPRTGYVTHRLENGDQVRFKGNWKQQQEKMRECILLFAEDEVVLVPLSGSLLHLKKDSSVV